MGVKTSDFRKTFAILTSAFDVMSNDLLAFILHQTMLASVPYSPVLHDLSLSPRNMKAEEMVEFWLEMYERKDVTPSPPWRRRSCWRTRWGPS